MPISGRHDGRPLSVKPAERVDCQQEERSDRDCVPDAQAGEQTVSRSVSRQRVDDMDGSRPAHTVAFALDGQWFEIDLSEMHAAKLREVFAPYIAAGRKVSTAHGASAGKSTSDAGGSPPRRRKPRGGGPPALRVDSPTSEPSLPSEQSHADPEGTPAQDINEPSDRPRSRTPETTEDEPLAVVVPLPRRPRSQLGAPDIAGQRRRLVAEVAELTRVVAVAALAAATDRLIGAITKQETSLAPGEDAGHRIPGSPGATASTAAGKPSSSARTSAGEVELTEEVTAT